MSVSNSLSGEAYSIIRERILRGQISLGEVISRRRAATELGMSLLPVSEAFLRLEFEGLIESRPRAGTRVRIPSREDVEGHYIVREALEIQAARLYAQRSSTEEPAAMLKLATRVDAMSAEPGASAFRRDRAVYLGLHETLHRRIAEFGRCAALCDAIEKTCALSSIWLCTGGHIPAGHTPHRHRELIEALAAGDLEFAVAAMRQQISSSRDSIMERLQPYFVRGGNSTQVYARGYKK